MNKYKISVIVPCYNVEKYIARCLDSLLKQDFKDSYEIVVVNDGTKDSSAVIAEKYAIKYPKVIRVIHKPNGGLSSARNYGIDHSESDYLAFVDSDDYVSNRYLSTLNEIAHRDNADIVMCGIIRTSNSEGHGDVFESGFSEDMTTTDIDGVLSVSSYSSCNKLFKRSLIENIRFPEGVNYEDYATIPQLIYLSKKISYVNQPLYFYFVNTESITGSMIRKVDYSIIEAYKVLSTSILSERKDLLEILFIRRVILSMSRSIIKYDGIQKLYEVQNYMHEMLPDISKSLFLHKLKGYNKMFAISFVNDNITICRILEFLNKMAYSFYQVLKKVM